ncbi:MAG: pilus assembly protein PilP [Gammaproteobacteria bacterium]|nr:MAG: pilus assembly protein PilP [Gammaproteobacteria bacterium]
MNGWLAQAGRGWLIVLALLGGCTASTDTSDLERFVQQVRARKAAPIEPLPEFKPYETFLYQAFDRRSPFVPSTTDLAAIARHEAGNGVHPDPNRPREPLEEYALDSLRMVGTLEKEGRRWALIQTPEGTVHRVTVGNYLGRNNGRIVRITDLGVELKEIVPDGLGGWKERKTTLALTE